MHCDDDACPICGEKMVSVHSPLDKLGCPNCGSLRLDSSEGFVKLASDNTFVVDFTCMDCGFKWLESRTMPKRFR